MVVSRLPVGAERSPAAMRGVIKLDDIGVGGDGARVVAGLR